MLSFGSCLPRQCKSCREGQSIPGGLIAQRHWFGSSVVSFDWHTRSSRITGITRISAGRWSDGWLARYYIALLYIFRVLQITLIHSFVDGDGGGYRLRLSADRDRPCVALCSPPSSLPVGIASDLYFVLHHDAGLPVLSAPVGGLDGIYHRSYAHLHLIEVNRKKTTVCGHLRSRRFS